MGRTNVYHEDYGNVPGAVLDIYTQPGGDAYRTTDMVVTWDGAPSLPSNLVPEGLSPAGGSGRLIWQGRLYPGNVDKFVGDLAAAHRDYVASPAGRVALAELATVGSSDGS